MKFRLTAYITVIIFLGVVASSQFVSSHSSKPRHMDSGLLSHQELVCRKIKKPLLDLVSVVHPLPICVRTVTVEREIIESPPTTRSSTIIVNWRAPPVMEESNNSTITNPTERKEVPRCKSDYHCA